MTAWLPLLFHGEWGVCGWIPVSKNGVLYVVLSISICRKLTNLILNTTGNLMDSVFNKHMRRVRVDAALFKQLMLCTPFMVYKKGKNMTDAKWLTDNLADYVVVHATWFKELMQETRRKCEVPSELPIMVKDTPRGTMHMSHDLSISSSYTTDPKLYDNLGDDDELTHEELSRMPAVHFPFWREAYECGSVEYFEMKEVDGVLGHVLSGKAEEPTASAQVRTYDYCLSAVKRGFPGSFSDDVKERYPEEFEPVEHDAESGGEQQQGNKRARRYK